MGIIYKIIGDATDGTDKFLIYIGSTNYTLENRMSKHISQNKKNKLTPAQILNSNWFEYHVIETTDNLKERERYYIEQYSKDNDYIVINKNRPIISEEERKQLKQDYYNNHRDELIQYHRNYKKTPEYKIQQKAYYETFKNKQQNRYCEKCDKIVSYFGYSKHLQSKKHNK
jgi:hypothetical protein